MNTIARHLVRMAVLVLLAGIASALLVRFSPGAMVDERELDPRLSQESLAALRAEREAQNSLSVGIRRYFQQLVRGDLGYSASRNAPIATLLAQNFLPTLRRLAWGIAGGWMLGWGLAVVVARFERIWTIDLTVALAAGLLLSVPASILAYFAVVTGTAVELVLVLVMAPRVFRFSRNLLIQAYGAPYIAMARARGIGELRILGNHVLRGAGPQLATLAAASVTMGIGAIIPVEAICDAPGLGRLAWQAAMARDLPLLVNLTMLIALATTAAMAASEIRVSREAMA